MLQLMFVFFFVWQVPETPFGIILFSASSSKKTVKILDSVFKLGIVILLVFCFLMKEKGKSASVQFSCSVVSNSLQPHRLQHTRLPCPSPTPRAYSNSCPLSQWCHPIISSSFVPFSSRLQSFPKSGSVLHIRWPKFWSFSFSISPSNEYSGLIFFRIDWLDLLAVQGTLKSLRQHHSSKASILQRSPFFIVQLTCIHDYWKNHSFD